MGAVVYSYHVDIFGLEISNYNAPLSLYYLVINTVSFQTTTYYSNS